MLILLLRVVFVLLCMIIGNSAGRYFYRPLFDQGIPDWVGLAIGFSVGITLIAAEIGFRRRFTRSLVAFLVGLAGGLILSGLTLNVLRLAIQNQQLVDNLDAPLVLVITYLVLITVLRHVDRFRLVLPYVEFRAERFEDGALVLDGSALRDSRIQTLIASGIIGQRLIIRQHLIRALEAQSLSNEPVDRVQGKRALDNLAALRAMGDRVSVTIDHTEIPGAKTLSEELLGLARLENARIVSNNAELVARARAETIGAVSLNELTTALAPTIKVGETLLVTLEKVGDNKHQGVGHLDDGSMVIVSQAAAHIGETVRACIVRLHQSGNGRMVFCQLLDERDQKSGEQYAPDDA